MRDPCEVRVLCNSRHLRVLSQAKTRVATRPPLGRTRCRVVVRGATVEEVASEGANLAAGPSLSFLSGTASSSWWVNLLGDYRGDWWWVLLRAHRFRRIPKDAG